MTKLAAAPRTLPMLLTASGGCAMSLVDTNIVAVSVPTLTHSLGADAVAGQWIISAFFLGFAASLMAAGAIADRFGRRRIYLFGLAGLAATSLICSAVSSLILLQISRAGQGVATAFVLPPALAMIGHRFREPQAATRAWMIWGCVMGATMVLAPLIGGVIVQHFGWRAAFLINLPLCATLFAATFAYTTESFGAVERRLDPWGIFLFAAAIFGLAWALINGQTYGWHSGATLAGVLLGVLAMTGFVIAEKLQSNPMIAPSLFQNPAFIGAVWSMLLMLRPRRSWPLSCRFICRTAPV